mmetsp:Transcript_12932/g.36889  ORF Transcript_12932/g.36889 Transcript_12932/m.36889 type:complete len:194 (+) Transcript_12932:40-621(+)
MSSPMVEMVLERIDGLGPRIDPKIEQVKTQLRQKVQEGLWPLRDVDAVLDSYEGLLRDAGEVREADLPPVVLRAVCGSGGTYAYFLEALLLGRVYKRIDLMSDHFAAVQDYLKQKLCSAQWSPAECNRYLDRLLRYISVLKRDCRGPDTADEIDDADEIELAEEVLKTLQDSDAFEDALASLAALWGEGSSVP